jgi:ferric-dicitrate binding protein FerR (iron transport regulator)
MATPHLDWTHIARLVVGDASESDEVAHLARLRSDPTYAAAYRDALTVWRTELAASGPWDAQYALRQLEHRLSEGAAASTSNRTARVSPSSPRRVIPAAAARSRWPVVGALAAAAALVIVTEVPKSRVRPPATRPMAAAPSRVPPTSLSRGDGDTTPSTGGVTVYRTAPAQTRTIILPDGSTVQLLPGSRLTLVRDDARPWGATTRRVQLTGEAFFDVVSAPTRPFLLTASHVEVRVLGTGFLVSTMPARYGMASPNAIAVAVHHGRVGVRHAPIGSDVALGGSDGTVLRARQAIVMSADGQIDRIDATPLLDAEAGTLSFVNATPETVARELARWYPAQITVDASVDRALRITARFARSDLETVLDHLAFVSGLAVERQGTRVRLIADPR